VSRVAFGHTVRANQAQRVELARALTELSTRCRTHGPSFADTFASWAGEVGTVGTVVGVSGLTTGELRMLSQLVRIAAGREPQLRPLQLLADDIEQAAYGPGGAPGAAAAALSFDEYLDLADEFTYLGGMR
jgi:hypothetical protein